MDEDKIKYLIVVVSISTFAFWISSTMLRPVFPLYLSYIGFTEFEIGIVLSIPQLLSIFLRVPLSSKAKEVGRVRFLTMAMALNTLALLLYFLATSDKLVVVLARLVHTLPIAAFGPVAMAYVSIISPERRRGGIMGVYLSSVGLSVFLGPLITSGLTTVMDIRSVFLVAALPTLLCVFLLFRVSGVDVDVLNGDGGGVNIVEGLRHLWRNKGFVLICISALLYSSSMGFFRSFFPLFLESRYLIGAGIISLLYSVRGFTNVLSRPVSGFLSDRIGVGIMVVGGLLITSLMLFILSLRPPLEAVALVMAIYGAAWGVRAVSSINFIGFYLSDEDKEMGMAIFYNMFDIGVTLGSVTGGALLSMFPYEDVFLIYSGIVFLAAIVTVPLILKGL